MLNVLGNDFANILLASLVSICKIFIRVIEKIIYGLKPYQMKKTIYLLTKSLGIGLILFQLYIYFSQPVGTETFKEKHFFYNLSFLIGYNLYLLSGMFLILVAYIIKLKLPSKKRQ